MLYKILYFCFFFFFAGETLLICKGAESTILERSIAGKRDETLDHVNDYAMVSTVIVRIELFQNRSQVNDYAMVSTVIVRIELFQNRSKVNQSSVVGVKQVSFYAMGCGG